MPKTKTVPFDPAEFLTSEAAIIAYLEDALADSDPSAIAEAVGVVARARGMTKVAKESGLGRESLYKSLASDGNPELGTIVAVLKALGLRLSVERIEKPAA
jgi:probable addiction module antidote protein